jgi:hypothetical protein
VALLGDDNGLDVSVMFDEQADLLVSFETAHCEGDP